MKNYIEYCTTYIGYFKSYIGQWKMDIGQLKTDIVQCKTLMYNAKLTLNCEFCLHSWLLHSLSRQWVPWVFWMAAPFPLQTVSPLGFLNGLRHAWVRCCSYSFGQMPICPRITNQSWGLSLSCFRCIFESNFTVDNTLII